MLAGADTCAADVAEKLVALARAGVRLVALDAWPSRAESLEARGRVEDAARALAESGGAVVARDALARTVREAGADDVTLAAPHPDILCTHRVRDGRHVYFLCNCGDAPVRIAPTLRVPGPYELRRPLTGNIEAPGDLARLSLDGYEGVFVVAGA